MRFATLATACVAALTSVNAQAIDQAYIGVSPSLFSSLLWGVSTQILEVDQGSGFE